MTSKQHLIVLLVITLAIPALAQHRTFPNNGGGNMGRGAYGSSNQNGGMGGSSSNGMNNNNGVNNGNNFNNNNGGQMNGGGGGGFGGGGGGGMGQEYKESHNKFSGTSDKETSSEKATKAITETGKKLTDSFKPGADYLAQVIKDAPKDVTPPKELTEAVTYYDKLAETNSAKIKAQGDFMVDGIAKSSAILQSIVYSVKLPGTKDPNANGGASTSATASNVTSDTQIKLNGDKFSGVTDTGNTATTAEKRALAESSLASATTASPLDAAPRGYKAPSKKELNVILK